MGDLVITLPYERWADWLAEGDLAVIPPAKPIKSAKLHKINVGRKPEIEPGERVYVTAHNRLRGYAPLVRIECRGQGIYAVRAGEAVAVTIPRSVHLRWIDKPDWRRDEEIPFLQWQAPSGEWDGIERVIVAARAHLEIQAKALAAAMDWSAARLRGIETRKVGVRPEEIAPLLGHLKLDEPAARLMMAGEPIMDCLKQAAFRRELAEEERVAAEIKPVEIEAPPQPLPPMLPEPRTVATVLMLWSDMGEKLKLEASVNGHRRVATIPKRHQRVECARLIDSTETAILREFGITVVTVPEMHRYVGQLVAGTYYQA